MLRCGDGSLYTGWAADVPARLALHRAGKGAKYTRSRRASLQLVYFEPFGDRAAALRREAAIKRLSHAQKEALIAAPQNRVDLLEE